MNKELAKPQQLTVASKLYEVQREIALLQEDEKTLKDELLKSLKKQHVKSVKLDDGSHFIITERQTLKVKDEEKAKAWLDENYCWKADTGKALKILRRSLKKVPSFFKVESSEYLTIKKSITN